MLASAIALAVSLTLPIDGASTLHRVGLDAEALCAAGVTAPVVATVVSDLVNSDAATNGELDAADTAFNQALTAARALWEIISQGQATPEQIGDLPTLEAALSSATQAREDVLDTLFTAGTSSLSFDIQTRLATIRGNRAWDLPIELLLVNRNQEDWVTLRDHLSQERVAAILEEPLESEIAQALATARSHPETSAAFTRINANFSSVEVAWHAAVAD